MDFKLLFFFMRKNMQSSLKYISS